MPLRDHFPPLSDFCPWSSFHANWSVKMVDRLNTQHLERGRYTAQSGRHFGAQIEADVAALERVDRGSLFAGINGEGGGVATAAPVLPPPAATFSADIRFDDPDPFEVKVYRGGGGWHLVAAIELVSEANKDRKENRRAFAVKCGSYLQKRNRARGDRHRDELLGQSSRRTVRPDRKRRRAPADLSQWAVGRCIPGDAQSGRIRSAPGFGRLRLSDWSRPIAAHGPAVAESRSRGFAGAGTDVPTGVCVTPNRLTSAGRRRSGTPIRTRSTRRSPAGAAATGEGRAALSSRSGTRRRSPHSPCSGPRRAPGARRRGSLVQVLVGEVDHLFLLRLSRLGFWFRREPLRRRRGSAEYAAHRDRHQPTHHVLQHRLR